MVFVRHSWERVEERQLSFKIVRMQADDLA
jgi:hypothetical protein